MAYSKVEILDCQFKGPSFEYLYERIYSLSIKDMNGAFIAAYQYSNLTIQDTTFKGGRGNLGGCILLLGLSEAKITAKFLCMRYLWYLRLYLFIFSRIIK